MNQGANVTLDKARSALTRSALIMAAGTGGHIMPGLAIATQLQARDWTVQWLGTTHGMENQLVPAAGLVLNRLVFAGLRGKGKLGMVKGAWQLAGAFLDAIKVLRRVKPSVVVGMGGYVCVPGAWAARLLRIPVVLVNADADLLLSNKTLASFARTVCCGFEGSAAKLANAVVTGNPVRASIASIALPQQRYAQRSGALNVLVLGGSLGAQVLNETVPAALALIENTSTSPRPNVQHQTGAKQILQVQTSYQASDTVATVLPFIDDMAAAYAWADVVICRSGAITVSELCAAGVPAILVPLELSTTSHQTGNALHMVHAGAALHIVQTQLTAQSLALALQGFTHQSLLTYALAAKALGKPLATQAVVNEIEKARGAIA